MKREVLWDHQAAGIPLLYIDKGYHRVTAEWGGKYMAAWWRMCWNATHPTAYFMDTPRAPDRWRRHRIRIVRNASRGERIVILGSSEKFHLSERLPHPTTWTQEIVDGIRRRTPMEIIYRPKPSWTGAEPIKGAEFSHGWKTAIRRDLEGAFCSVTYGSIASVDSILAGVPCVVLGNAVARPISSTSIKDILNPIWESQARREQWAANLAYCQFTPDEIASGVAWKILKETARYAV